MKEYAIISIVVLYICWLCYGNEPTINIEQGTLKGKIKKDFKGNVFYAFFSVPYAKPPVGELRFEVSCFSV